MPENPVAPLRLGRLDLADNLIQAPLAGYSSFPFRLLAWRFGRPGLLATEMISANALRQGLASQERYLRRTPAEGPIMYQIWGSEPEAAGFAAAVVTERGAAAVDLNCGCPVRKVRAAGAGSRLMEDIPRLARLVGAMRKNTSLPLSIKIRLGPSGDNFNAAEAARAAEAEGADWLTVHGRHARESYASPCRLGEIRRVVEAVGIPVIGNGDVRDGAGAREMFEKAGVAGIMLGRACLGAPWIFARVRAECSGESWAPPAPAEVADILLRHHDLLAELLDPERAIRQIRKLGSFYSRSLAGAREFRNRLNFCRSRDELAGLAANFFHGSPVPDGRPVSGARPRESEPANV
ncbi:MAG: tRNA-dihydrouridine synthase [Planctomycetota bacterium]|jgi:nifR3 family TIM-barrel protein|nr:tRNA-dihydrouridine synthase [Planctomycetota bacterium]